MSDNFEQYLITDMNNMVQTANIQPAMTWNDMDPVYGISALHAQTPLSIQMQMFPPPSSNILGLNPGLPMYLPACNPHPAFDASMIHGHTHTTTITPSAIQLSAPFMYSNTASSHQATRSWNTYFTYPAPPPIINMPSYSNDPSLTSGSSPSGTTRTLASSVVASSNAGSDYAYSPSSRIIKLETMPESSMPVNATKSSRPASTSSRASTSSSNGRRHLATAPLQSTRPSQKRKRAEIESDLDSGSASDYEDSGCDSDSDSEYSERLTFTVVKSAKKVAQPKSSESAKPKIARPPAKKIRLNNGEAKEVETLGEFICGQVIKYKGKGSQYTMKGLTTPEVGDVCMMRCINQTDLNRHRQKTLWHCEPEDRWACEVCGKVLNSRVDNQTRHAPKCRGVPDDVEEELDEDAFTQSKVRKAKKTTAKKPAARKGKGRAY